MSGMRTVAANKCSRATHISLGKLLSTCTQTIQHAPHLSKPYTLLRSSPMLSAAGLGSSPIIMHLSSSNDLW